jgi:hypothetical protein
MLALLFRLATLGFFKWLGRRSPLAFNHLCQDTIVISTLIFLPTNWIDSESKDFGRLECRRHHVTQMINVRHRRHTSIDIHIILQKDFKIYQYKIRLKGIKSTRQKDMTTYPYLFGRVLRQIQARQVSAPMNTRFTRSTALFFSMRSTKNRNGFDRPRYSKPIVRASAAARFA